MSGWIKLHRKLLDSKIFSNPNILKFWMWSLLKASHSDTEQLIGLQTVSIQKGQFIFGRKIAAKELDMTESNAYKILKWLEKESMIVVNSNNKFSVVTIVNWEFYQGCSDEDEQQKNNKVTTKEQQSNTNKNVKNLENVKEVVVDEEDTHTSCECVGVPSTVQITQTSSEADPAMILENKFIQLRGSGTMLNPIDYPAIQQIVDEGIDIQKACEWLEDCFKEYKPKHHSDKIRSFKYCLPYIMQRHYNELAREQAKKEAENHGNSGYSGSGQSDGSTPERSGVGNEGFKKTTPDRSRETKQKQTAHSHNQYAGLFQNTSDWSEDL